MRFVKRQGKAGVPDRPGEPVIGDQLQPVRTEDVLDILFAPGAREAGKQGSAHVLNRREAVILDQPVDQCINCSRIVRCGEAGGRIGGGVPTLFAFFARVAALWGRRTGFRGVSTPGLRSYPSP